MSDDWMETELTLYQLSLVYKQARIRRKSRNYIGSVTVICCNSSSQNVLFDVSSLNDISWINYFKLLLIMLYPKKKEQVLGKLLL